ncbi:MAG: sigma-70 family RNA polymerase sigma factor [Vicinamibacterales bacterium]
MGSDTSTDEAPLDTLLRNRDAFLSFLETRVGDRALAEDILQDAFIKVIARPDQAPTNEGVVPWFYRSIRNAAIDRFRRTATASKALEAFARELEISTRSEELESEICACVSEVARTLKPEYADALLAVDVAGTPVKTFAEQHGLTATNAGVRVHRARAALRKRVTQACGACAEHGCVDCTCKSSPR